MRQSNILALAMTYLAGCAGDKDDTAPVVSPVIFTTDAGEVRDLTETAAAGTAEAPGQISLDEPGELNFGAGTWFVQVQVTASGSIVGPGATLSGGGNYVIVEVPVAVDLSVSDLSLIDGYGCLGTAVRAAVVSACEPTGITPVPANLTLSGVDISGHDYDVGGGAVGITAGATLLIENSNLHGNTGHGVYAMSADVTCNGQAGEQFGIWGNGKNGVYVELVDALDHIIQGTNCDFGDDADSNTLYDVSFTDQLNQDYGDDTTFTCSSASLSCR